MLETDDTNGPATPDETQATTRPKRAPRKAAAKKAAPPADEQAQAAAPEPAKKATRARKSTAKAADADAAPAAKKASKRAAAKAAPDAPADEAAPAKRGRTKRAAQAAGTQDEQSAPAAPAGPPPMLFVAPADAPPVPVRRRSRGAAKAEPVEAAVVDEVVAETEEEPDEVREVAAEEATGARRRRRRGRRGRGGHAREDAEETREDETADEAADDAAPADDADEPVGDADEPDGESTSSARRRRRRRRKAGASDAEPGGDDPPNTVVHVRESRNGGSGDGDGVRGVKGSTRLEAKRQRRREGRDTGRRRPPILSEAEFLARRESVNRVMAVRQAGERTQIAVLEDDILVEHYVTRATATSYVGNVYLGRVQNVLPSMEAAFVDIGKGRNGVLYAGEVNWDAAGLEGKARAIETALSSGDTVLVQVTKDPIGHKGARLTSQVSLPGRFLVYVPGGAMTGISRKLPDVERHRLKAILKKIVPEDAGVIVRTAAEGASEEDLTRDVERLKAQWQSIEAKSKQPKAAPTLVYGEPDLAIRVVRDVFNEDFHQLIVSGADAWDAISGYVNDVAPDLADRVRQHTGEADLFHELRIDEQLTKALDRKVFLPSGGSLVIDRTEAMTVVDVNTGKFIGSGGNLEQTVTRNNLEAAEEIVRQLRLRDVGGIVVIDFIDMVLESNRDLVLRRLTECLGRDRTKHQVAEVTSLGLVQMTRKRVGEGLLEAFSETCPTCGGRGVLIHSEPVDRHSADDGDQRPKKQGKRGRKSSEPVEAVEPVANDEQRKAAANAMVTIAGRVQPDGAEPDDEPDGAEPDRDEPAGDVPEAVADEAPAEQPDENDENDEPAGDQVAAEVAETPDGKAPAEPAPRRRRRAASRPAGPPVAIGAR
jgi:ribonuclease E